MKTNPTNEPPGESILQRDWRRMKAAAAFIKKHLLAFRLGDFYEFFNEDARAVAKALNIALTKRMGLPMCGIPAHAEERYFTELVVKHGYYIEVAEKAGDNWKVIRPFGQREKPGTVASAATVPPAEAKEPPADERAELIQALIGRLDTANCSCYSNPEGACEYCSIIAKISKEIEAYAEERAALQTELANERAALDWMISRSAYVSHSRDGDVCNVWYRWDDDGQDGEPVEGYPQKSYTDAREAIAAAMADDLADKRAAPAPSAPASGDEANPGMIQGQRWEQYLAWQFPATTGHIPLHEWIKRRVMDSNIVRAVTKRCDEKSNTITQLMETLGATRAALAEADRERDNALGWKQSALTVESWWQKIDAYVRKLPDAPLGRNVSEIALEFLQQRAALALENARLRKEIFERIPELTHRAFCNKWRAAVGECDCGLDAFLATVRPPAKKEGAV